MCKIVKLVEIKALIEGSIEGLDNQPVVKDREIIMNQLESPNPESSDEILGDTYFYTGTWGTVDYRVT